MKIHRAHPTKVSEDPEHHLFEAIVAIKTVEEAKKFFQDLCTPTEIEAMADRWLVVDSIKTGKPYRQIYDETGVSVATIGRVARCVMLGQGGYNLVYERLEKKSHESNIKKNKNKTGHSKKRAFKQ